jgi:hypothetical protein
MTLSERLMAYLSPTLRQVLDAANKMLAYRRLRTFFESQRVGNAYQKVFSSNRIFELTGEAPASFVATALSHLVTEGFVDQIVRVEPRFGEGIGDFPSIEAVPAVLDDWRHPGTEVQVTLEHLRVYYKLHRQLDQ